jgi:hypothetical protein
VSYAALNTHRVVARTHIGLLYRRKQMGRPLKIKESTTVDIGFNAFASLTVPVYPDTFSGTEFLGVVGGANANVATTAYPVVKCRVRITGTSEDDGYIITQKGTTKYLVAAVSAVNDEDLVVGASYRILTVGTTDWRSVGATTATPAVGDVFTAVAVGAGTGTAQRVGVCVLANQADGVLSAGNMNITFSTGDSTAQTVSRLTNKYVYDYSTPPVRYAANFFTDEGIMVKSGTTGGANVSGQQNRLDLAIVENYTS